MVAPLNTVITVAPVELIKCILILTILYNVVKNNVTLHSII